MIQSNSLPFALADGRKEIHRLGFSQNTVRVWLKPMLFVCLFIRQLKQTAMNFKCVLLYLSIISANTFAQDFHHRQADSVEELLYKKDRNKALALFNKEKFLVVENLRSNQRNRYFVGDLLRFKTKDGFVFADDIYEVKDSSFVITALNETTNRYEYVEIKLNEVTRIYKRPKRKIGFGWQTFSPFGYLVFEWAAWGVSPLQNNKWPIAAALTVAQPLFTVVSNQFRSRKITENYRLRVFKSF